MLKKAGTSQTGLSVQPSHIIGIISFALLTTAHAEMTGFYAGAQLGYANSHIHNTDLVTITNGSAPVALPGLNHFAFAYRLNVGYQFDCHFAMEFGYRRFSHNSMSIASANYSANASSKVSAFDFLIKGIAPINAKWATYAKLGVAYLKPNSQGSAVVAPPYLASVHRYTNTLEPAFALGVSYALKPNVPVEFSWNRIQKLGGNSHAPSSDFYALGVTYYFG